MSTSVRRLVAVCGAATALGAPLVVPGTASAAAARPALDITTVSSRPDAVSGGDALVRVDVPSGVAPGAVRVQRNGSDVTRGFRVVNGDLLGLVDRLVPGRHRLTATAPRTRTGSVTVTAHPGTGPVFSGPQQQPFACETTRYRTPAGAQVGEPLDANCSIATRVEHVYRSTAATATSAVQFKPLPDGPRPADLATTTTLDGRTVPYIVRVQIGTVNRGIYEMASLHDPATPAPDRFNRSPGWNGKLVYTLGGGCRAGWYQQGSGTGGVLVDSMLSRGFAVASNSLNVFGNNCSDLLTSESLAMTREEFIEDYGPPTYTMGWGCSGGSYQAHQAADSYPGLLDGIVVGCSFPDVGFATSQKLADARLLNEYFRETGSAFTLEQQRRVSGFGEHQSIASQSAGAARLDPDAEFDTSVPVAARYDAATNTAGARGTVWDHTRNAYGVDPTTGFARRPLDNVGVQYGLQALKDGDITLDQFLDLNEGIGGLDIDANLTDARMAADPLARQAAYRTGRILDGGQGLATTPIIDHRAYSDLLGTGDIHQRYHSFSTRERLAEANGDADNQVMLVRDISYGLFDANDPVLIYALEQMDQWILAAQSSGANTHDKVVAAKPAGLTDSCWERGRLDGPGELESKRIVEQMRPDGGRCHELYPTFASPRIVAGGPIANDVITCRTTEPRRRDYPAMRDADWQRLRAIFPQGVCNYDRPGVDERGQGGTWARFTAPGSWTFLSR